MVALALNVIWPGSGIILDSCYGPAGFDLKVALLGWGVGVIYYFSLCCWWFFFFPLLIALVAHIFAIYHGYLVYKKSEKSMTKPL